ncbi:MAG: Hsp20/alpha crystallin family protein [Deltaproteobacteria bacterium]|nr:Hsp20/alpha crystallin family protein [Deltaproteobacteria bacterium]
MLSIYRPTLPSLFRGFWPSRRLFESSYFPEFSPSAEWLPNVEITHEKSMYTVKAELPGIDRDNISIDVNDGVMTLKGEKKSEREEDVGGCYCSERYYGSFERSFVLPAEAKVDEIKAHLDKGVLTITVPAPVAEEGGKKIEVTVN